MGKSFNIRKLKFIKENEFEDERDEEEIEEERTYLEIENKRKKKKNIDEHKDVLLDDEVEKLNSIQLGPIKSLRKKRKKECRDYGNTVVVHNYDKYKNVDSIVKLENINYMSNYKYVGASVAVIKNDYKMKITEEIMEQKFMLDDISYKRIKNEVFRNIKDLEIWKRMIDDHPDNAEYLKCAILETENDEFIDKLILLGNIMENVCDILYDLYLKFKDKNMFKIKIMIFLLNKNYKEIWSDIFKKINIKLSIEVLENINRSLEIPEFIFHDLEIKEFIKNIPVKVYTPIPLYLEIFFCSIIHLDIFDESLFCECYDVVKFYILNLEFVIRFFVNKIKSYAVDLLKAKEIYKLLIMNYIDNRDLSLLKTVDRILSKGVIKYPEYKKDFIMASSKVHYNLKGYASSYSILKKIKNPGIRKFLVLSKISLNICERELKCNLKSSKAYLLYIEVLKGLGLEVINIYEDCLKKFKNDEKIALGYLRYIKDSNVDEKKKILIFDNFILKFNKSELIWYEMYLFYKRIRKYKDSLSILKNSTRFFKSDLINMELAFIENRKLDVNNKYYLYYEIRKNGLSKEEMVEKLKYSKNGDCLLFWYYLEKNKIKEIEKIAAFLELKNGIYWPRVVEAIVYEKFEDRLVFGLRLLEEDLFFEK